MRKEQKIMESGNTNISKLTHFLQVKNESGLEMLRLIQLHFLGKNDTDEANMMLSNIPKSEDDENGLHAIGTWHPVKQGERIVFKRKEQTDSVFWESTCNQFYLEKEVHDKRVCVIGESAAAGMFFTPFITPAKVLTNYLEVNTNYSWEVIDLTRNCMNAGALIETCRNSLQLKPDYIVIIAGNNWFSDIMVEHHGALSHRRNYANSLSTEGVSGVIETYQKKAEKLAENVMLQIDNMAADSLTKFIFAIPALNYADFERRVPLHWLNNEKTMKWYEYYNFAVDALDSGDYEKALDFAKKMYKIDEGHNSTSSRILANCYLSLGKDDLAYKYCVSECDNSLIFDEITSFPAVLSFVRREYGENNSFYPHIKFLDFETVLSKYYGTKVLGKNVFVDYCHLNPEGFHVVMASIADLIINGKKASEDNWMSLAKNTSLLEEDSTALAVSYFCAALYNSHLNRPVSNILNLEKYSKMFQRAVEFDKSILDIMKLYIKGRSCVKGLGFTLSKAGQKFFELMNSPLDFPVAQEAPGVDALTVESICMVLDNNGMDGYRLLKEYQKPYIRTLEDGIDLTEPVYIEWINSYIKMSMDSENGTRRRLPFYKSWWPRSFFSLVADGKNDLAIELTCRLPIDALSSNQKLVRVAINDQEIQTVTVGSMWTKRCFNIPSKMIKDGFNRLSIEWPIVYQKEEQKLSDLNQRYSKGLVVDFFPVLGEIYSLIVRNVYNS